MKHAVTYRAIVKESIYFYKSIEIAVMNKCHCIGGGLDGIHLDPSHLHYDIEWMVRS